MRDLCSAAVAPADRRLFETGWSSNETLGGSTRSTWVGLKVGWHTAGQF